MKMTMLILYSQTQYDLTARAVGEFMSKYYIDCDVVAVEERRYSNLKLNHLVDWTYRMTARSLPKLNFLVRRAKESRKYFHRRKAEKPAKPDESFVKIKTKLRKVDNALLRFRPDLVLCATPHAYHKAIAARARLGMDMPIYAVMTDYCLNPRFLDDGGDGYLVQNYSVGQALQNKSVDIAKIFVTGTPLPAVRVPENAAELREKLGAGDLPVVTLAGGRYGCDYLKDAFSVLAEYAERIFFLILTDGSNSLKKYLKGFCRARGIARNVALLDDVTDMEEIYAVTDVLVTSATAGMTCEAFARGIPCVLIRELNAVEKGNFGYLTSGGFALRGNSKDTLIGSVLDLLNDKDFYARYAEKGRSFAQDDVKQISRFCYEKMTKYRAKSASGAAESDPPADPVKEKK